MRTKLIILTIILAIALSPLMGLQAEAGTSTLHSWDVKIDNASKRFEVLDDFNNEAVLDKETGLVWEKSPSMAAFTWLNAQLYCNALTTGNRLGWRLPTLQELASLVDTSVPPPGPTLPSGHPFSNVQSSDYWSATTNAALATYAWGVSFYYGVVANINGPGDVAKASNNYVWCVRGGQGVDPQ